MYSNTKMEGTLKRKREDILNQNTLNEAVIANDLELFRECISAGIKPNLSTIKILNNDYNHLEILIKCYEYRII